MRSRYWRLGWQWRRVSWLLLVGWLALVAVALDLSLVVLVTTIVFHILAEVAGVGRRDRTDVSARRQTVVLGLGSAVVLAFGIWLLASGPSQSTLAGSVTLLVGLWGLGDALAVRRIGHDEDRGAPSVREVHEKDVFETLSNAAGPLAPAEVAEACELDDGQSRDTLYALRLGGLVERHEDGYVANDIFVGRLDPRGLARRFTRPLRALTGAPC